MTSKQPKKKIVKAWAFMASVQGFIPDIDGEVKIFLRKPKPRLNPFDYSSVIKLPTWKPTPVTITFNI